MKSSSHFTTIFNPQARFIVVTGKGGVGKTTLALAMTKSLVDQQKNVFYVNLEETPTQLLNDLNLPYRKIDFATALRNYVDKKIQSSIVSTLLAKIPLLPLIAELAPGLPHLILLENLLTELLSDPNLYFILDAPATGHAITLFDSPETYMKIFQSGEIFNEMKSMREKIKSNNLISFFVVTNARELSFQEGLDLLTYLEKLNLGTNLLLLNNALTPLKVQNLPPILQTRLSEEKQITEKYAELIQETIPLIPLSSPKEIIHSISSEYVR